MKKLLVILLVLCSPCIVLADSASPSIIGYEAVIINKKGAKHDDGTIPYNTKVFVRNEYGDEVEVCYTVKGSNSCYTISNKDIAPFKKEVLPKDLPKKDNDGTTLEKYQKKIFIIGKKGVKLKKGPASAFGEYNQEVPYKTFLTASYVIYGYGESAQEWYYVDDGQYKGWIENNHNIATIAWPSIMMFDDVKMYDIDTDEEIAVIPSETIFNEAYLYGKIYLKYNDKIGYIEGSYKTGEYSYSYEYGVKSALGYVLTTKSIELSSKGKTLTAIPKGERIKILYASSEDESDYTSPVCLNEKQCLYYVEYNGVKGFINDKNVISLRYDTKPKITSYPKDLKLYDAMYSHYKEDLDEKKISLEEYNKKYETSDIIPANTEVTFYKDDYIAIDGYIKYDIHLVKYNNKIGWVIVETDDNSDYNKNENKIEPTAVPPKDNVMNKSTNTIIYSIIGALIVGSIAMIILFLVNKKKKAKAIAKVDDSKAKVNTNVDSPKTKDNVKPTQDEIVPVKKIKKNKTVNTKKK